LTSRAQLQAGQYRYAAEKVKPERLQRAIEATSNGLRLIQRANRSPRHGRARKATDVRDVHRAKSDRPPGRLFHARRFTLAGLVLF